MGHSGGVSGGGGVEIALGSILTMPGHKYHVADIATEGSGSRQIEQFLRSVSRKLVFTQPRLKAGFWSTMVWGSAFDTK